MYEIIFKLSIFALSGFLTAYFSARLWKKLCVKEWERLYLSMQKLHDHYIKESLELSVEISQIKLQVTALELNQESIIKALEESK